MTREKLGLTPFTVAVRKIGKPYIYILRYSDHLPWRLYWYEIAYEGYDLDMHLNIEIDYAPEKFEVLFEPTMEQACAMQEAVYMKNQELYTYSYLEPVFNHYFPTEGELNLMPPYAVVSHLTTEREVVYADSNSTYVKGSRNMWFASSAVADISDHTNSKEIFMKGKSYWNSPALALVFLPTDEQSAVMVKADEERQITAAALHPKKNEIHAEMVMENCRAIVGSLPRFSTISFRDPVRGMKTQTVDFVKESQDFWLKKSRGGFQEVTAEHMAVWYSAASNATNIFIPTTDQKKAFEEAEVQQQENG